MDRALAVTELLENVLIHIRCIDILRGQRVSKTWRAAIQGSLALQKAICNVPVSESELEHPHSRKCAGLSGMHQNRSIIMTRELSAVDYCKVVSQSDAWAISPFFGTIFNAVDGEGDIVLSHGDFPRIFSSNHQSYLDMYLTQPPIRRISLRMGYLESAVLMAEQEEEFLRNMEAFEREKERNPFRAMSSLKPRRRTFARQPMSVVLERWDHVNGKLEPLTIRHLIEALERKRPSGPYWDFYFTLW